MFDYAAVACLLRFKAAKLGFEDFSITFCSGYEACPKIDDSHASKTEQQSRSKGRQLFPNS